MPDVMPSDAMCHVHPIPVQSRRYEAIEEEVVINRDALEQVAGDEEAIVHQWSFHCQHLVTNCTDFHSIASGMMFLYFLPGFIQVQHSTLFQVEKG